MASNSFGLGPSFTPGGLDDFCIPQKPTNVVSPAPQRTMQEVPGQLQDNIASIDLNGGVTQPGGAWTQPSAKPVNSNGRRLRGSDRQTPSQSMISPTSSVFPKLRKRTPNVPPSDEEKLAVLDAARVNVLNSPNAEMQLAWAQDALTYAAVCIDEERRSQSRPGQFTNERAATKVVEQQVQADAINIVMYLADQFHPRADYIKGMWLEFGRFGFLQDSIEAFRCYKRSAAKGYARAEYRLGMQYESTGEYIKALQHYKNGEIRGDAASCYRIGMMALLGQLGQPQDFSAAVHLIRQAADAADENAPQGAYVYGMLQARELPQITVPEVFLPADLASARFYIEKSAFLGFSKAQLKMGSAYELCSLGCEFDPSLSLHYNLLAAKQGEAEAEMSISKWFLCGYHGVFHKNEELAFIYAQRAADNDLATAQFAVGYFYEIGVYVGRDLGKAREWYEAAAQNGNTDARGRIDGLSRSRTLSKTDHENIAISRIKSRHGSRRGNRPDRPSKPPTPMPSIPDEYLQKPRVSRVDLPGDLSGSAARRSPPQPRLGSATPYPVDDRPVPVNTYSVDHTVKDGTDRLGPAGGFLNLNLDQRPFSTLVEDRLDVAASRYSKRPQTGSSPQYDTVGTSSGTETYSRPVDSRREPNSVQVPAQYTGTSNNPHNLNNAGNSVHGTDSSPVEKIDIGFSAPIEPRAQHLTATSDSSLRRTSAKANGSAVAKSSPHAHRNSAPKTSSPLSGRTSLAPTVSSIGTGSDTSETRTSRFSFQSVRPPVPPKGPQTFEEMGVPRGKDENDCIIM